MSIIQQVPWRVQPQSPVGLSDLASSLQCRSAYLAPLCWDAATKQRLVSDGTRSQSPTKYGIASTYAATGGVRLAAGGLSSIFDGSVTCSFTIMILANVVTSASRQFLAGDYSAAGSANSFEMNKSNGNVFNSSINGQTFNGSTALNGWHWLELAYDASATYGESYTDGILQDGRSIGARSQTGTELRLHRGGAYTSEGFTGSIAASLIFKSYLSRGARNSIKGDPWGLFAPKSRRIWVPVSAGGGGGATLFRSRTISGSRAGSRRVA